MHKNSRASDGLPARGMSFRARANLRLPYKLALGRPLAAKLTQYSNVIAVSLVNAKLIRESRRLSSWLSSMITLKAQIQSMIF